MSGNLIEVRGLKKSFQVTRGAILRRVVGVTAAVDNVDLDIKEGEILGCVGGSGSGKSTLGRLILRLIEADEGRINFAGRELTGLSVMQMRPLRREMQIVFQDPLHSLNPRRTVAENVERPLLNFGVPRAEARGRVAELLTMVGLDPTQSHKYPHEYSGGQCQRIAIARALALRPRFLFLDEPVSSLDVSIQAQILNLLQDLQQRLKLTFLFVSHDLKIVRQIAHRTVVMYRGRLLELGESDAVYRSPMHPFTKNFLGTVLHVRKGGRWELAAQRAEDLEDLNRQSATHAAPQAGCVYAGACAERFLPCASERPPLFRAADDRWVACHLYRPPQAAQ